MEIIFAKHLGFCYGVKRAVKMALEGEKYPSPVYTLGPLIHNPQIVNELAAKGINATDSLDTILEGTVIIRSHGVGPDKYRRAAERQLTVVDATCLDVKKVQLAASAFTAEGVQVVIVGDKNHPEIHSVFEWTGETAIIIESIEDAVSLPAWSCVGIVAQTTFPANVFDQIVKIIKEKCTKVEVKRTICLATAKRQAAAGKLASQVDLMLIIGGRNSANTARLTQICEKECRKVLQLESAEKLYSDLFVGVNRIGITAGASTPDYLIEEVDKRCRNLITCMEQK